MAKTYNNFQGQVLNQNITLSIKEAGKTVETIKKAEKVTKVISTIITYAFIVALALLVIFPFYWMIITSLKSLDEITGMSTGGRQTYFPEIVMWSNYVYVFQKFDFSTYMVNTVVVAIFSTIGTLLTTVFAAFAFSRLRFKGRETVFAILLMTMMIPGEMMVLSNYITVASFGWIESDSQTLLQAYACMIVPFWVSVFYIYLLRQNFKQIPNELYLAAKVDGKSDWNYLWKVMVPLAAPTLISISILKFMGTWNSYMWPQLVCKNEAYQLISNGLLYIKANKKIINIINFAMNNPQFLSIQEKDEKIMKEILEKCNKALEQQKKKNYKDLIVILDRNSNDIDTEKLYRLQTQQYKAITTIFENFMSINDRFAYYTFGNEENEENKETDKEDVYINYIKNNSIKKLISLTYKNNKNYSFIKGIIDKFHDDIIYNYNNQTKIKQMYLNLSKEDLNKSSFNIENSFLKNKTKNKFNSDEIHKMKIKYAINAIFKVINDLNVHDEERKKFLILISESFKSEQNDINISVKELFKDVNECYKIKIERLFIIGSLLEEHNKFASICSELMNYNIKNEYLEFENIQEMNKKFLTLGTLPRRYEYRNEKINK